MRKSPLIIIPAILIGLTGVYALVANLLPDTSEFPRIPTADGTIGGYIARILGVTDLANYVGDGTVENTTTLSGLTANDILKYKDLCLAPEVWKGIDGDGKPVCGTDIEILAYLGTGTSLSGTVTAYHASGSSSVLALGSPIREGDIIKTNLGAGITITFLDGSLLRIDGDSTVSLDIGTTYDGQSIAYAILENGGLWGRVLTETGGYYIGNDDVIAGVRGTSVGLTSRYTSSINLTWSGTAKKWDITKFGSPMGELSVVHSRRNIDNEGGVVEITCKGKRYSMNPQNILYLGGINCDYLNIFEKDITYLYEAYPSIATNTIADLNYMSGRLAVGSLTPSQRAIFMSEFEATKPEGTEEKTAICNNGVGTTRTYWDSFVGRDQTIFPVCQDSNILAYANYGNTASEYKNLYQSTSNIFGSGYIDGANKPRLVYTGSQINTLLSQNWTMTLNIKTPTSNPSLAYIGSLSGSNSRIDIYQSSSDIKMQQFGGNSVKLTGILPDRSYIFTLSRTNKSYTISIPGSSTGITLGTDIMAPNFYLGRSIVNNFFWSGSISTMVIN